jgi:voltage-gated potassium channel
MKKSFTREFFSLLSAAWELLFFYLILICAGGFVFHIEGLKNSDGSYGDCLYTAFVTSFTIGYGDMTPNGTLGRITSVVLAIIGMMFIGIIIGASIKALERCK